MTSFAVPEPSRFDRVLRPLLMVASLVPIWSAQYFPSQNGPWHLLTIHMLREYSNPAFNYAEVYVPSIHAIPHLAHTLLVYALTTVFPLLVAHKLAISLYVLLLPVSVFWFLATASPRNVSLGYVSFLLVYNVPLFRGYHDFVLGIPLTFIALTYWLRNQHRLTAVRVGVQMLFIVLVYLSHLFNFLMLGLAMLVYTLHASRSVKSIARLALVFTPGLLLLAEFVVFSVQQTNWMNESDLKWLRPHTAVEGFFRNFLFTLSPSAYAISVVALVGCALVVIWSVRQADNADGRHRIWSALTQPAAVLVIACVVLYFATPFKLYGWHYVNVRFVPYVIVFGLAAIAASDRLPRRAFVTSLAAAALVIFGVQTARIRHADRIISEYVSGLGKVRTNASILTLSIDSEDVGEISAVAHAYDYYHVFRGGANGKGLAMFNTVTPLVYRTYPVEDRFPTWPPDGSRDLRRVSATYDYVLTWGVDSYVAIRLKAAGFDLVHDQGKLRLFENRRRKPADQTTRRD